MKKFIIFIIALFCITNVNAKNISEISKDLQDLLKPYVTKVLPNSYIIREGESENGYFVTYSYNSIMFNNSDIIERFTPLTELEGFNVNEYWKLNNYNGVESYIDYKINDKYKFQIHFKSNPEFEPSEGRLSIILTFMCNE